MRYFRIKYESFTMAGLLIFILAKTINADPESLPFLNIKPDSGT
jgi:hypothetical protein